MKKSYLIFFFLIVFLSCDRSKNEKSKPVDRLLSESNLEAILAEKNKLLEQISQLQGNVNELNIAIKSLDTATENIPIVSVIKLKDTLFRHFTEVQGLVKSRQNVVLRAEFTGILKKINFPLGTFVKKGTVIARIDTGGLEDQLSQVKTKLDLSEILFRKREKLWKEEKIGSEVEYLRSKATYESDKNAYRQLQQQLKKTFIKAPFSGVIDDIITDQGNLVGANTPVIRLVNTHDIYVESMLPESYLNTVKKSSQVLIQAPTLSTDIVSKVRYVAQYIDPENRSFKVEIEIPRKSENMKPNLLVKLKINDYTNDKAILIPQDVISEDSDGRHYIYTIKNLKNQVALAHKVYVSLGHFTGNKVELTSSIPLESFIIKEGTKGLKDQQKVKIINDK